MDSLGDYIYLIVIGIAALSGILKKKKKTPVATSSPEDILTEFEEETKEYYPQEVFSPEIYRTPKEEPQKSKKITHTEFLSYESTNDISELKARKQVSRLEKNMQKNKDVIVEDDVPEELLEIRLGTASEAKRAFIYSEIFNRKY